VSEPLHTPPAAPRSRPWLALVVLAWGVGTAVAFWALALKDRRVLDPEALAAHFDAARVAPAAEAWLRARAPRASHATVVNVVPEHCSCAGAVNRHVAELEVAYRGSAVAFLRARPEWVRAAPAALVFDASGTLVYFGPYSDEADCGSRGGFVEQTLDQLLAGRAPRAPRPLGLGCFCLT
jgi:hypothetical protein